MFMRFVGAISESLVLGKKNSAARPQWSNQVDVCPLCRSQLCEMWGPLVHVVVRSCVILISWGAACRQQITPQRLLWTWCWGTDGWVKAVVLAFCIPLLHGKEMYGSNWKQKFGDFKQPSGRCRWSLSWCLNECGIRETSKTQNKRFWTK